MKKNKADISNCVKNQKQLIVWIDGKRVLVFEKIWKIVILSLTTNFKICSLEKNFQQLTSKNFIFLWWKIRQSEKIKTTKRWSNKKSKTKKKIFNEYLKNSCVIYIFLTIVNKSKKNLISRKKKHLIVVKT